MIIKENNIHSLSQKRVVKLFMELVQIDSVSREERGMVARVNEIFEDLGFFPREDRAGRSFSGNAGNLIVDIPGRIDLPCLLFCAHLDRVQPGRGIKPLIKDGYIISSGDTVLAGDDLIGVAAIIEALRLLKGKGREHCPVKLIFTVAEEVGLLGAKGLAREEIEAVDYGFVLDVDGDIGTVVYKAPSQIKFNAVIRGKAAHAGINPGEGVDAIRISSRAISRMKLGQIDEETTANVGVIKGGRAINIVPDMVELQGEVRSHSEKALSEQREHIKEVIEEAALRYGGEVEYRVERLYNGFELFPESDIINLARMSLEEIGKEMELVVSGAGSDANIFNEIGLQTLNLGVGMEKVHSSEERVALENLVELPGLVIRLIQNAEKMPEKSGKNV